MESWEKEKKGNLIGAFSRVLSGEPADGGNSLEETEEYLIEFRQEVVLNIKRKVEELRHEIQQDEMPLGNEQWKEGHTKCLEEVLTILKVNYPIN